MKKDFPRVGQIYRDNNVEGKVISLNLMRKTIMVETKNKNIIEVEI